MISRSSEADDCRAARRGTLPLITDHFERMDIPPPESTDENAARVLRRIRRISVGAYVAFAVFAGFFRGFRPLLGLTCSAAVTMISFLWLEEIVEAVLQPSPALHPRRLIVRTLGRFLLLGVALPVTLLVARFDALSVLLGFSIVVVGIAGEALYTSFRGLSD